MRNNCKFFIIVVVGRLETWQVSPPTTLKKNKNGTDDFYVPYSSHDFVKKKHCLHQLTILENNMLQNGGKKTKKQNRTIKVICVVPQ